jgi:hypothetical protein
MPLDPKVVRLIRGNIALIKRGGKPRLVVVGYLTDEQLEDINAFRKLRCCEPIEKDVVFVGSHVYESRVMRDGYSEDDFIVQIESAISPGCRYVPTQKMTMLQNGNPRQSGDGCFVRDELTLECSTRFPRAELYSEVPRGDRHHKPKQHKRGCRSRLSRSERDETPG